jgi:hypothetical protein
MAETNRIPLTIRLRPEDKQTFVVAAEQCGLEPGIAARTVLELMVRRIRTGRTFFQAVGDVERALLHAELDEAGKALGYFKPRDSQAALVERVVRIEDALQKLDAKG